MFILTLATAVGCGLNAGIFYAFSSFVMRALGHRPPAEGAAAMQRINVDVINPWFMAVFMGTPAAAAALLVWTAVTWADPARGSVAADTWRVAGALLHLLGCFAVTIAFNVPLNNRLERADAESEEGQQVWAHYLKVWTWWNTVRTICPAAAMVALMLALAGGQPGTRGPFTGWTGPDSTVDW